MPDYYLENVLPLGVLTGSRAFKCATEKSDWDIVILQSKIPKYKEADDYQSYNFNPEESVSEIPEIKDEANTDGCLNYDQATIWGPLECIVKYWYLTDPDDESTEVSINLFVYEDRYSNVLPKFKELNNLMNFFYNVRLKDKEYRIKVFTDIISQVGITDAKPN